MAVTVLDLGDATPPQPGRAAVMEHLSSSGLVDEAAISRAALVAARTGQPVEQVLNQLGALSDDDLVQAYAKIAGCEVWDPVSEPISVHPSEIGVSTEFLRRARLAPIRDDGRTLTCAACDPLDRESFSGLVFATGRTLALMVARPADWRNAFEFAFTSGVGDAVEADERRLEREIDQVSDGANEGAGARLVAAAFEAAIATGASDIHFEPRRHDLRIRLRIDGRLTDHRVVGADLAAPTVSRVKVIANLDLGEKRLPQDGRTTFVIAGRQVDVRVATSPSVFGESAVLRILDRTSVPLDLDGLGLPETTVRALRRAARTPHGLFLVTGPTGSGKTTTLYALMQTFAGSHKKVLSIEDPVEYHFEHITQTQVAPQVDLTFAKALRSFLRQDPDVILVGEIRDAETSSVAVQAAMTGHLVLASIHANDALAVIPRLLDMGIEPYQLAAAFRGAAAQRLVRRLCTHCRFSRTPNRAELVFAEGAHAPPPALMYEAAGCGRCGGSGFKGRLAIGEAYFADEALLRAIADGASTGDLAVIVRRLGFESMATDGLSKMAAGLTTLEEVMAAVDA